MIGSKTLNNIWLMFGVNFGILGFEIATSIIYAIIPPTIRKQGLSDTIMSWIMGMGPFLALLLIQPVARWSDRGHSGGSSNRRMTLIFLYTSVAMAGLTSLALGNMIWITDKILGVFMTVTGIAILDTMAQMSFNPCEALVADFSKSEDETTSNFIIYSKMIQIGAILGYLLPSVSISQDLTNVCVITILILTVCSAVTLISSSRLVSNQIRNETSLGKFMIEAATGEKETEFTSNSDLLVKRGTKIASHSKTYFLCMIFLSDFLSWLAVMGQTMFCTEFVATAILKGVPDAPENDPRRQLYDEGVRAGSFALFAQSFGGASNNDGHKSGSAGLFSFDLALLFSTFLQSTMIRRLGLYTTYSLSLFIFGVGLIFIVVTPSLVALVISAFITGIGNAVVSSVPYTLVSTYEKNMDNGNHEEGNYGSASDFAILDSSYFLAQVFLAIFMGPLVDAFQNPNLFFLVPACLAFLGSLVIVKFLPRHFERIEIIA